MILANREIRNYKEIENIIINQKICCVAFSDDNIPYVLPFNYYYENNTIYLHSAPEGKKNEILKKNNKVCVTIYEDGEVFYRHENVACSYGWRFKSVVINGTVEFITDLDKKVEIMNKFMKKYTGKDDFKYNEPAIKNVCIMKISIDQITGKKYGK